jgi:hypothetical protein
MMALTSTVASSRHGLAHAALRAALLCGLALLASSCANRAEQYRLEDAAQRAEMAKRKAGETRLATLAEVTPALGCGGSRARAQIDSAEVLPARALPGTEIAGRLRHRDEPGDRAARAHGDGRAQRDRRRQARRTRKVLQEYGAMPTPAAGLRERAGPAAGEAVAPQEPGMAFHRAGQPGDQRLRPARRLCLRHPRPDGLHGKRGRPGRGDRPRDRPRHRPPRRAARHAPADGGPRGAGRHHSRRGAGGQGRQRCHRHRQHDVPGRGRRLHRLLQPRPGVAGGQAGRRVPGAQQLRPEEHGRRDPRAEEPGTVRRRHGARRRPQAAGRRRLAGLAPEQRQAAAGHRPVFRPVQGQVRRRGPRPLPAGHRRHDLRREPRTGRHARAAFLP